MTPRAARRNQAAPREIVFGVGPLTIEDVLAVAQQGVAVRLADEPEFRRRIRKGSGFLERLLDQDGVIYGVTTGYGDSCTVQVPRALVGELPLQLARLRSRRPSVPRRRARRARDPARLALPRLFWRTPGPAGAGGRAAESGCCAAHSGGGSVGASGDLTPLSYVAALLVGERDASHGGTTHPAADLHRRFGLRPLSLHPKEGLAVMNGTAVMTALACEAFARADYLSRLATRLTALASMALGGNRHHFDERLFAVKPHPGTQEVAAWLRRDLGIDKVPRNSARLQDRYSIRCAPHVIGVLRDSLPWMRRFLEIEINSTNDNPVIDGEEERIRHGGHFYGGHVAFVMDSLKTCVANLADLMDRQLALLVDPKFNHGLPANLSGACPARQAINHGFKGVQIGASAWAAEALKLTMPASVFSRSTECHNQDKVSMGTIAARDCLRILQLTEQVAAAETLAVTQAIGLRRRASGGDGAATAGELDEEPAGFADSVLETFTFLEEDRPLEPDLRRVLAMIQQRHWPLYG